jgi:hypothetical protein
MRHSAKTGPIGFTVRIAISIKKGDHSPQGKGKGGYQQYILYFNIYGCKGKYVMQQGANP